MTDRTATSPWSNPRSIPTVEMSAADLLPGRAHGEPGGPSSASPARAYSPFGRHNLPPRKGAGKTGAGQADLQPAPVASFTMPTPPSTNTLFRNVKGRGRVKTSIYDDFVRRGVTAIRQQSVAALVGHVVAIFGVERMSAQADIDNRLKAMLDTIVEAGVIEDDRFITAIAISWLPKANGLSWVKLLPAQRLDLTFHPSHDAASGGWFMPAAQPEGEADYGY